MKKLHHKSSAHHLKHIIVVNIYIFVARFTNIYIEHLQYAPCRTQASQALNIIIIIHFRGFEKCGSCILCYIFFVLALGCTLTSYIRYAYLPYMGHWHFTKLRSTCNKPIKINNLENCFQRYNGGCLKILMIWEFSQLFIDKRNEHWWKENNVFILIDDFFLLFYDKNQYIANKIDQRTKVSL